MDAITQNLKFALRSLVKAPAFSLTVVATLALGIGANTAIFSILHALVLRSLPVAEPDRLVVLSRNQLSMPYPLFRHFQEPSTALEGCWRSAPPRGVSRPADQRSGSPEHSSQAATSRFSAFLPPSGRRSAPKTT
jgi:hypothetical protein